MGEIHTTATSRNGCVSKRKTRSTRVDLTPMVDLGFLLITFFIFTTSMSEPRAMKLIVPSDQKTTNPQTISESKTLNIIVSGNNKFITYNGSDIPNTISCSGPDHLRRIIIEKKKQVEYKFNDPDEISILIKPTETATYENLVNVLDEMHINDIKRYVFMEPSEEEKHLAEKISNK